MGPKKMDYKAALKNINNKNNAGEPAFYSLLKEPF
jgi:hypothetical protein